MPINLRLTATGKRFKAQASRNGMPFFLDTFSPDSSRSRAAVAMTLGVPEDWFLDCVTKGEGEYEFAPVSSNDSLCITVRGMYDREGITVTGDPATVLADAIVSQPAVSDPIVEWKDETLACFLDIDYHHISPENRPSTERLSFLMARIQPAPVLWFLSRSGGVHALYVRQGEIPASVLSAVAGFSYSTFDPTCTFECKPESRLCTTELHRITPTSDLSAVSKFLSGSVSESDVSEYLDLHSLERGKAYEHDKCPVNPHAPTHGKPVWVGEGGISCRWCAEKANPFGSRRAGYFPYTALCGTHELNEIARMVNNFTHWTQAQIVLEARCRLRGKVAKLAYEGMLRLRHGEDERVEDVFRVGEHLIRGMGRWVTPDRHESLKDLRPTLSTLPAVQTDEGKAIPERLDLFCQTCDLSRFGYPSIRPLFGMRVFGEYLGNDGGPISVVLSPPSLVEPGRSVYRPRYVPESRRLSLDVAWERVESVFPGINRNYLLLLLAARGVSEGEIGIPPNIMCCGVSASGKSSTVHIAASILGDVCTPIQWNASPERFRQGYLEGADSGGFVLVDELFKDAKTAGKKSKAAVDIFLNLTPGSLSHKMYTGPVPLGRLPVTVVTDNRPPADVRNDIQLSRRFVYVYLDGRINWVQSLIDTGVRTCQNFRASSIENAEASNAIASHVIDRWFRDTPLSLETIAESLGFSTLENSDEIAYDEDALPNLFNTLCATPATEGNSRLRGRGWHLISFEDETPVAEAWRVVCDGTRNMDEFGSSRRVEEVDWSTIVPVPKGTRCDVSRHGRSVAVRFRCGEARGGNYKVNGELRNDNA